MKNNLIKVALGMILAVGSAKAADASRTFTNGYYFQRVSSISNNLTKTNGPLQGKVTVINQDQRWSADTVYILDNLTFVEAPAVLTIEPGTIIRGEIATSGGSSTLNPADPGSLIICQGAKLNAVGTALSPICFTSIGDPFCAGGVNSIPVSANGSAIDRSAVAAQYNTQSYGTNAGAGFSAHNIDAQWGGVTLLGKARVGFGGPTGAGGQIQITVTNNESSTYTQNPIWTFSGGTTTTNGSITWANSGIDNGQGSSVYKLEPLFLPAQLSTNANNHILSGGKFKGSKPSFVATAADNSRTADKAAFQSVVVSYNFGTNGFEGSSVTTSNPTNAAAVASDTVTAGDDYWEITGLTYKTVTSTNWEGVVTTNNGRGLFYNVPTKGNTAPFITTGGFGSAEIAVQYTMGGATNYIATNAAGWTYNATNGNAIAPTAGLNNFTNNGTTCAEYPVFRLKLEPTQLYGVIVKVPGAYTLATPPTVTISGGNSDYHATARCEVAGEVGLPSANPLRGGIGANFIEGFQAIDGTALGDAANFKGGVYGGTQNSDDSGTMRFCRLSFGGYILSANNEINGITYGGVGSGTVTEFCEVFNNADDDFEMFGGCNNLKYVAGIFGGDDGFDTDQGYRGLGQFMFQLQNNTKAGTTDTGRNPANIGDNLGENDGNEDPNVLSASNPSYAGTEFTYFNLTAIGIGYTVKGSFPSDRSGPNFKDNSGGKILNSVYVEAPSGAIQDQATTTNAYSSGVGAARIAACLASPTVANEPHGVIAYNTWSKCGGGKSNSPTTANYTNNSTNSPLFPTTSGRTFSGGGTINNSFAINKLLVSDLNNRFFDYNVVDSTGTLGRLAGVSPKLHSGATLERTNGTDPGASIAVAVGATNGIQTNTVVRGGGFFARNTFRGAFKDFNWLKGWTLADQLGGFAPNGSVTAPDVSLTRDGSGNLVVNFYGVSTAQYNIEVSSDNKTYTPYSTVNGQGDTPVSVTLTGKGSGRLFARVIPL